MVFVLLKSPHHYLYQQSSSVYLLFNNFPMIVFINDHLRSRSCSAITPSLSLSTQGFQSSLSCSSFSQTMTNWLTTPPEVYVLLNNQFIMNIMLPIISISIFLIIIWSICKNMQPPPHPLQPQHFQKQLPICQEDQSLQVLISVYPPPPEKCIAAFQFLSSSSSLWISVIWRLIMIISQSTQYSMDAEAFYSLFRPLIILTSLLPSILLILLLLISFWNKSSWPYLIIWLF